MGGLCPKAFVVSTSMIAAITLENRTWRYKSQEPWGPSACDHLGTIPLTFAPPCLPLLVSPALNKLVGNVVPLGRNQGCIKLVSTSCFSTPRILENHRPALSRAEYLKRRVTQCWENSENTQGPGSCVTCLLPRRASWATARERGCMFLPKTVNRYHCKQPTFVIFIKLYLGIFTNVHTHIQDPVACDSHRIPCADRRVHTPPWPVDEE